MDSCITIFGIGYLSRRPPKLDFSLQLSLPLRNRDASMQITPPAAPHINLRKATSPSLANSLHTQLIQSQESTANRRGELSASHIQRPKPLPLHNAPCRRHQWTWTALSAMAPRHLIFPGRWRQCPTSATSFPLSARPRYDRLYRLKLPADSFWYLDCA